MRSCEVPRMALVMTGPVAVIHFSNYTSPKYTAFVWYTHAIQASRVA